MCILSSASEMSLLNAITCDTSCCMLVSQSFQEVFNVAWKFENAVPPVIALSFHSSSTEDVDHEAFSLASVIKVQFVSPARLCFSLWCRTLAHRCTRSV